MPNFQVPLEGVVYERLGKQYQGEKRGWRSVIFYLRCIDRQRSFYHSEVKEFNRLFLLGIWDFSEHSLENPPYEWAYSARGDQIAMFEHVLKNIVKPDERRKFVDDILGVVNEYGKQARIKGVPTQ